MLVTIRQFRVWTFAVNKMYNIFILPKCQELSISGLDYFYKLKKNEIFLKNQTCRLINIFKGPVPYRKEMLSNNILKKNRNKISKSEKLLIYIIELIPIKRSKKFRTFSACGFHQYINQIYQFG